MERGSKEQRTGILYGEESGEKRMGIPAKARVGWGAGEFLGYPSTRNPDRVGGIFGVLGA